MRLYVGRSFYLYLILFTAVVGLTGCDLIGDIFEVGLWVGVIIVVILVLLIFWIVRAVRKRV